MKIRMSEFIIDATVKRVKYLRLVVKENGEIRMSIPYGTPTNRVEAFINEKADWIRERVTAAQTRQAEKEKKLGHTFEEGDVFMILGRQRTLHLVDREGPYKVELKDDTLVVFQPKVNQVPLRRQAINAWLARTIQELVIKLVKEWMPRMGLNRQGDVTVRLKVMKTLWGRNIPTKNDLCFNYRLIFYPKDTIESIVVHELCHFFEPSHNAHFYNLMSRFLPNYKEREKPLKVKYNN